jgi:hypothetical protein
MEGWNWKENKINKGTQKKRKKSKKEWGSKLK